MYVARRSACTRLPVTGHVFGAAIEIDINLGIVNLECAQSVVRVQQCQSAVGTHCSIRQCGRTIAADAVAAHSMEADYIVTSNKRDFPDAPYGVTRVLSAGELLDQITFEI